MSTLATLARRAIVGVLLLVATGGVRRAEAQQSKAAALINAVLDYRANWIGDSTRVDACSVYRAMGAPANFPAGIDTVLVRLLDRTTDPCAPKASRAAEQWPRRFVSVDSLSDGAANRAGPRVTVRVVKGEHSYHETYSLRVWPNGGARGVSVAEVRTWGFLQFLPIPPSRRIPSGVP